MKIEHKNSPFYHIQLKDVFSKIEINEVKEKLNIIKPNLKSPELTGPAKDLFGKSLKKNSGIFIEELKFDSTKTIILNKVDSIFQEVLTKSKWINLCFKRNFETLNWGCELLQYYKSGDYYEPHCDMGTFTLVLWLYEDYEGVEGGNLYFPEYNYLYHCRDNYGIIFFSKELHGVTTLKSKNNFGRYSITTFSVSVNENTKKEYRKIEKNTNLIYN